MRAWNFLRQLVAVMLAALLAVPACSFEKTPAAVQPHDRASGGVYSKTHIWGSDEEILLHFSATVLPSEKQHGSCANRVSKTVAGVTTKYLVSDLNPTGFAQVVAEFFSGSTSGNRELTHSYVYGLERVSQRRQFVVNFQNGTQTSFYLYDGHGSVRALTDTTGAITDTYDYDAFGNLISHTGTTPNNYLFSGEQFDPDLHLYFLRARYLNTNTGRFLTIDPAEGRNQDPASLHRYLYAAGDPVNRTDPSGRQASVAEAEVQFSTSLIIAALVVVSLVGACAVVALATKEGIGPCTTRPPEILYHYTAADNLEGIVGSAVLLASPTGAFGPGQYFTDIRPFEAESHSKEDLSTALFNFPSRWSDSEVGFIGVNVQGLNVSRKADVYGSTFPGKGIFLNETTVQLPLVFRLKSSGILVFAK